MFHLWLGFSCIPKPSVFFDQVFDQLITEQKFSSHCWKKRKRTQYCFNSPGFGESFIFTQKQKWVVEDMEDRTGQVSVPSSSSVGYRIQLDSPCARLCLVSCDWWTFTPGWIWLAWEDVFLRGGRGRVGGIHRAGLDCAGEATPRWEEHIGRGGERDWLMVMWSQNTVALEPNEKEVVRNIWKHSEIWGKQDELGWKGV